MSKWVVRFHPRVVEADSRDDAETLAVFAASVPRFGESYEVDEIPPDALSRDDSEMIIARARLKKGENI